MLFSIKALPLHPISQELFLSLKNNAVRQRFLRLRFSFKVYVNGIRG